MPTWLTFADNNRPDNRDSSNEPTKDLLTGSPLRDLTNFTWEVKSESWLQCCPMPAVFWGEEWLNRSLKSKMNSWLVFTETKRSVRHHMEKKDQILRSLSKTKLNVNGKNSDFKMSARKRKAKKEKKKAETLETKRENKIGSELIQQWSSFYGVSSCRSS